MLCLLLSVFATGCVATFPPLIPADYDLATDSHNGFIIGSIGVKGAPAPSTWLEWSQYAYRSVSDPELKGQINSAFKWNPYYMWGSMPLCDEDGLKSECGLLFAVMLPAGEYEFCCVIAAQEARIASSSVSDWTQPLNGYRFTVRPGEATYIGNLMSRICIGVASEVINRNAVLAAVGDVADMSVRDLPMLRAKYPQLGAATVVNETMSGEPWLWRRKLSRGTAPPYGWHPDCSTDVDEAKRYLRGNAG